MGQVVEITRRGKRVSSNILRNVPPEEIDPFAMALIEEYDLNKQETREILKSGDLFSLMVDLQEQEIEYLVHVMCDGEFEQLVGYKLEKGYPAEPREAYARFLVTYY